MSDIASILWLSSIAGLATTMGAVLVILMGHPREGPWPCYWPGQAGSCWLWYASTSFPPPVRPVPFFRFSPASGQEYCSCFWPTPC